MNEYFVLLTPLAKQQLQSIYNYIAYDLANPVAADTFLKRMEEAFSGLSIFPASRPLLQKEPWKQQGIHKLIVKSYLAYYWINEARKEVHILCGLGARMDQFIQLKKLSR